MFPIRDDNPTLLTPWVTWTLIAANAGVWLGLQGAGAEPQLSASVCHMGLIPVELGAEMPAFDASTVCPADDLAGWPTLVSSMFTHGGWFHLLGNLWFLWLFGNNVEDSMGHLRFLIFYLVSGLAAGLAQVVSDPSSPIPIVGASGAIGGVMGGYVLLYPRVNVYMVILFGFIFATFVVPAWVMLGYWVGVQVLGGLADGGGESGVAFWAHIGGFIAGAVLIHLFKDNDMVSRHPHHGWKSGEPSWRRVK